MRLVGVVSVFGLLLALYLVSPDTYESLRASLPGATFYWLLLLLALLVAEAAELEASNRSTRLQIENLENQVTKLRHELDQRPVD